MLILACVRFILSSMRNQPVLIRSVPRNGMLMHLFTALILPDWQLVRKRFLKARNVKPWVNHHYDDKFHFLCSSCTKMVILWKTLFSLDVIFTPNWSVVKANSLQIQPRDCATQLGFQTPLLSFIGTSILPELDCTEKFNVATYCDYIGPNAGNEACWVQKSKTIKCTMHNGPIADKIPLGPLGLIWILRYRKKSGQCRCTEWNKNILDEHLQNETFLTRQSALAIDG